VPIDDRLTDKTLRPALERRWNDALTAFDAIGEIGVLGAKRTRADTVDGLSE